MNILSLPTVKYVFVAAVRDRLILSLLAIVAVGTALSVFLGSAAFVEQNAFVLVFSSGALRILSVLGLVLFCVFFIRRSFDNKDVDYLLSRPISRVSFIVSHSAALSLIAIVVAVFCSAAVFLTAPQNIGEGHFLWGLSLMFELIIMVNAALFFSMVLPSASTSAMVVLGLYVLSRIIGILLGIVSSGLIATPMMKGAAFVMKFVSLIIPRLDLFAQTSWLLYGPDKVTILFILAQGIIFSALLVTAALVDLVRRQF